MDEHLAAQQDSEAERSALLWRELLSMMDEGLHVAAIIDPASFAQAWSRFGESAQARGGGSLFAATPQSQDRSVAPLLIPLTRTDGAIHQAVADAAVQSPSVVWLASTSPPSELLAELATKLHAELADGRRPITLRYFDPRVLPELLRVLDDRQRASLNRGIRRWWWLDRRNAVCRHDAPTAPPFVDLQGDASIALNDEQVQALLEASFVDRVLDVLARSAPACLRPFDRAQKQDLAARHVEAAAMWGLTSEFDCASYIAVSLQEGPDFASSPSWEAPMSAVKAGALSFSDAIEQWEARDDQLA